MKVKNNTNDSPPVTNGLFVLLGSMTGGYDMSDIMALFRQIAKEPQQTTGAPEYLICGLGNPGTEYARTRHNAGFMAIDYLTQKTGISCTRSRFHALCGSGTIAGKTVLIMKPQTYMNHSGEAVREAAQYYKIPPEKIIVLVDDVYLVPGRMRVRHSGTDGGHNGLKNIIYHLESDQFPRIRLGVGEKPNKEYDMADWVLGKLSDDDCKKLYPCLEASYDGICLILQGKFDDAMGRCNSMKPDAESQEKTRPAASNGNKEENK